MVQHHSQEVSFMSKKYLKTGEFASLCGVTKDTLFHYDDIGLLKPARVGENGYRLYGLYQLDTFDLISVLKEVGLTLHEIKAYIERRNTTEFLQMLKEQDKALAAEIERLKRLRRILKNTIETTQKSLHVPIDTIQFVEKEEEYFIITDGQRKQDEKSVVEAISEHFKYCNAHRTYNTFTIGEIIGEQAIADRTYYTQYYCSKIDKPVRSRHCHVKPAGLYAVKYIQDSYDMLPEAYRQFVNEVQALGYRLCGKIYEEDMLNYLTEKDDENYLLRIEGQVEPVT